MIEKYRRSIITVSQSFVLAACEPRLSVGEWACHRDDAGTVAADGTEIVAAPWSTGFEELFCDYEPPTGFCYSEMRASYTPVTSPVHSGRFAAAFKVRAGDASGHQTRCVREGVLPSAAYYGVWFLVPSMATNSALWNLVHFQGGQPSEQHGLWDISLVNGTDGALELAVYSFLQGAVHRADKRTPIAVGRWFHLEFYLKRAADATGEVALYQDGQLLLRLTNLITDDSDWGQWYVGNLATGLTPADSTLYVDDVTIRSAR